ncbi:hypothetical protein CkaCkLH20_02185 [Colletotrichum karsti]|uniref:Uncharacterized protein n=1 Tax=Colletotrichum karsti TaxID=1095194 RepID=A0A9P6LPB8_9PEZI|nr:uncharacterized protein CkaCkLH20_02185 [Colletotrichum karsti]KAF9880231.1 hypothetical protein CkaCkLH20_02185 [Colletotrichum karsti]
MGYTQALLIWILVATVILLVSFIAYFAYDVKKTMAWRRLARQQERVTAEELAQRPAEGAGDVERQAGGRS